MTLRVIICNDASKYINRVDEHFLDVKFCCTQLARWRAVDIPECAFLKDVRHDRMILINLLGLKTKKDDLEV